MSPANGVVVTAQTARVVAGARRKTRSGTRRPIFGQLSLVQQQSLASVKGSSAAATSSSRGKGGSTSSQDKGSISPTSVTDGLLVTSTARSTTAPLPESAPSTNFGATVERNGHSGAVDVLPPLCLPGYAWKLHEHLSSEVSQRRWVVGVYNAQIITGSAASIILAVVYAKYFVGFPSLTNTLAVIIFGSTILLPMYVTFLLPRRSQHKKQYPLTPARVALAKYEAEVHKFRVQVGSYAATDSKEEEELDRRKAAKDCFREQAQTMWNSIQPILSKHDLSDDFWNNDHHDDDTNNRSQSIVSPTDAESPQTRQGLVDVGTATTTTLNHPSYQAGTAKWQEELPCCIIPTANQNKQVSDIHLPLERDLEAATESTPMLPKPKSVNVVTTDESSTKAVVEDSDPYATWTLEQYVELRLMTVLETQSQQVARRQFWQVTLQRLVGILTAGASLSALVAQQWAIPIVLAVAAAASSILEAGSLGASQQGQTDALEQLQRFVDEWQQAVVNQDTENEKKAPNELVQRVEAVLVTVAALY